MIRRFWIFAGWVGVAAALILSLGPASNEPAFMRHSDKLVHMLSYTTLMFWWAQLYPAPRARLKLALALIALGIGIEWLQSFTPDRQSDLRDVLANTTGIVLGGWLAHYTPNLMRRLFVVRN